MKNITKQNVKSWQANSAAAFRKWLADVASIKFLSPHLDRIK
jgi:hypothetical protein